MYSDQQTGVIEVKPAVKIQSTSTSPGFPTAPRSVVQDPMPDDGSDDGTDRSSCGCIDSVW